MKSAKIMSTSLNNEERGLWSKMQEALKDHNSYFVRQSYYPHNMESWEKEYKEIEQEYRGQLEEMVKSRLVFEKKETYQADELEAANALVTMSQIKVQKRKRTEANENRAVRRSSRLSNKQ
jgi:agmatine/peptidylarginine deiminase